MDDITRLEEVKPDVDMIVQATFKVGQLMPLVSAFHDRMAMQMERDGNMLSAHRGVLMLAGDLRVLADNLEGIAEAGMARVTSRFES